MGKLLKVVGWVIGILMGLIALVLLIAVLVYPYEYVRRVIAWRQTDIGDYLNNFPAHPLTASQTPFYFEEAPDEQRVAARFETLAGVNDFEAFLERENTQAFIVIQDDAVVYENYFNGTQRGSMLTSFSVAKSFVSALIGVAIEDGYINSVEDPITKYLPELAERDPRFNEITIRHLLMMASGLDYEANRWAIFNGDDPITSYYPDQRKAALEFTNILDSPGKYFLYNKYHPQLLGLILERTTGKSVAEYMQDKIWDLIGMEFDGSMSVDSEESGFEKLEAGVNARAIAYAKFGRLYLSDGERDGVQVMPAEWIRESTTVDQSVQNADYYSDEFGKMIFERLNGYYKYMWYGFPRGGEEYDFTAAGDHGQYIYVSPAKNLIIVRNSLAYGELSDEEWLRLLYQFASSM
jgi:CubicO group peptidase (beta-lactamase class C family)